jgi:hypothetical protein
MLQNLGWATGSAIVVALNAQLLRRLDLQQRR